MAKRTSSNVESPEVTGLLDAYPEPAILLGLDYRILAANRAYCEVYGAGRPVVRHHCYEVSHGNSVPCDQVGESCPLKASLDSKQAHRVLHIHHTPRGEEHVDVEIRPICNEQGEVSCFIEFMRPTKVASTTPDGTLVGRSPRFNHMLELVQRVAATETSVLLLGESGTGKELVAKAIHDQSRRADKAFVPVECSGLSATLFESELFGHEKGAFTGAVTRTLGLVEAARGGTLFLDEVGDIPLALQVKLLRLLETSTYRRVGSVEPKQADFRLVCATHRDIGAMVSAGEFRQDLFYRISTFPIELPALRERTEDIPLLVETLLKRISGDKAPRLSPTAQQRLSQYDFPGNIRELRNILERALLLTDGDIITCDALPDVCPRGEDKKNDTGPWLLGDELVPLAELERRYIKAIRSKRHGDNKALASQLGISERTLYRKLKELGSGPDQ